DPSDRGPHEDREDRLGGLAHRSGEGARRRDDRTERRAVRVVGERRRSQDAHEPRQCRRQRPPESERPPGVAHPLPPRERGAPTEEAGGAPGGATTGRRAARAGRACRGDRSSFRVVRSRPAAPARRTPDEPGAGGRIPDASHERAVLRVLAAAGGARVGGSSLALAPPSPMKGSLSMSVDHDAIEMALARGADQQIGQYRLDLTTGVWWWSPETYRLHGFEPGEVVPTTALVLAHKHPEDRDRVGRML